MILIIDNYDSFTYNLVQLLGKILLGSNEELLVKRNDKISVSEIVSMEPRRILLSPGPGRPENAGVTVDVIKTFGAGSRFSAYVWDIRRLAKRSEEPLYMRQP